MAPATPLTKWRRLIKYQLDYSGLPTSNEMSYRQYVNIIFQVARRNHLGDDLYKINRKKLFNCLHGYLGNLSALPWEADVLLYTASLLMDATEEKKSPAFQGASLFCGACLMPVKINSDGTRYVCPHCNAQVNAGPNRLPLGIPVLQELRSERNRLHHRLDKLIGAKKSDSIVRDRYYREIANILSIPYEHAHIGLITSMSEVVQWDLAIDFIKNSYVLKAKPKEALNVRY